MQQLGAKSEWRVAKLTALALALLSLLFLLQVTPHTHANGHDEAACRLCQAAHIGVTPAVSGIVLTIPLAAVGEVLTGPVARATESFQSHSDPRGPPAEFLS